MIESSTRDFLVQLKDNNNKEWFAENKKAYSEAKKDYYRLAGELLEDVQKFDTGLEGSTQKDCVFRINRDIRFSTDKSPYKTNFGIVLSSGGKKALLASYYLHIEPGQSFIGGGLWMPPSDILLKVRKEISYFYDELQPMLESPELNKYYSEFDHNMSKKLSRAPKGFSEKDPAIDILKLKSFVFSAKISDKQLTSSHFKITAIDHFKALKPILDFLNRGIMSDEFGGL